VQKSGPHRPLESPVQTAREKSLAALFATDILSEKGKEIN
jgi:hypothetical protein